MFGWFNSIFVRYGRPTASKAGSAFTFVSQVPIRSDANSLKKVERMVLRKEALRKGEEDMIMSG